MTKEMSKNYETIVAAIEGKNVISKTLAEEFTEYFNNIIINTIKSRMYEKNDDGSIEIAINTPIEDLCNMMHDEKKEIELDDIAQIVVGELTKLYNDKLIFGMKINYYRQGSATCSVYVQISKNEEE